jgi:(S)-3,5-dihydroxyphenylglycine transaminase
VNGSSREGPALVADPIAETVDEPIVFLNEVMARYPDAISFAPGAPNAQHLAQVDVIGALQRFQEHVVSVGGRSPEQAQLALLEYGPSRGLVNDVFADALRRDEHLDVDPEGIVITVGAQEALLIALRTLCDQPGDAVAVVDPSFPGIVGAARFLGLPTIPVPEGPLGVDAMAFEDIVLRERRRGLRVRVLYVAPDFNNPTGTRMDLASRRALLDVARRQGTKLLEDNVYGFTADPAVRLPSLAALDAEGTVVGVRSLAKVAAPGLRIGMLVPGPAGGRAEVRHLARRFAAMKTMVTVNTPPVSQAIAAGLILACGGSLAELGNSRSEFYRENLRLLLEALDRHLGDEDGVTWNRPHGGFFVRLFLDIAADQRLLEFSAQKFKVLWTPMSFFSLTGRHSNEIRLSCSYLDPDEIETGVERLAAFLREVTSPKSCGV